MTVLERVCAAAARLDDDALAALANRGLVRRARKDLEGRAPSLSGERDEQVELELEGWRVLIHEQPGASTCSCPADGVCRHILAGIMFLGTRAAQAKSGAPLRAGAEVGALSLEEVERWAGVGLARRARRELAAGLRVQATDGPILVLELPDWGVACRYVAGSGPAGMLCSCHEPSPCIHRVAAVFGHRLAAGVDAPLGPAEALESSDEAPRTRDEIRLGVQTVCAELVAAGLSRLSPSVVQRLRTLATSAHGVDLPRLERVVRGLADEADRWLGRGPTASDEELLARAALADALARALARPTAALVGQHRGRYERVHDLELVGLGAQAWRTPSGYRGLTVHFWDRGARVWSTWTDARPEGLAGFDPVARLSAPGPWRGCASPAVAATSFFRLQAAWRSRSRRLSGRPATVMLPLGRTTAAELPAPVTRWSELVDPARRALVTSLEETDEGAARVLIQPASWLAPSFDPITQVLTRGVVDRDGRAIGLVVQHGPETASALRQLEVVSPRAGTLVFGVLRLHAGGLAVGPLSLIDDEGVQSLGLGAVASAPVSPASADDVAEGEFDEEGALLAEAPDDPVGRAGSSASAELEAVAASGLGAYRRWGTLSERGRALRRLGLDRAATALDAIVAAAGTPAAPAATLHAAWVLRLSRAALAVEQATSRLG